MPAATPTPEGPPGGSAFRSSRPPGALRTILVGSAGHVDHGKTRLIEALTGIDCDRLAEEKARGITIDLGFAELTVGDVRVGFVDVPGHERFLHNALAGLGGIRVLLLVVAADEGIMPQTREHVGIAALLGIERAVVALTKSDLATPSQLAARTAAIAELLAATRFAGAPVFHVSARTGAGIRELSDQLLGLAAGAQPGPADSAPARLPVDRVFQPRGQGVVVTGTLLSGSIASGDTLERDGGTATVRVRSVQVHGQERNAAHAGERTALQLAGAGLEDLQRGTTLSAPGGWLATSTLLARLTLLAEAPAMASRSTPVRLHLFTASVLATARLLDRAELEPGGSGIVEIRTAIPVVAARGDRFVLRRPSPIATYGGGEVLDPAWRRRRRSELPEALAALIGDENRALLAWVHEAGERGATAEDLARRAGTAVPRIAQALDILTDEARLLAAAAPRSGLRRWLAPSAFRRVAERAGRALTAHFAAERLARGMSRAELLRRAAPAAGDLGEVYLGWLVKAGVLELAGDLVNLPGRTPALATEESSLATAVLQRFEAAGLAAPSPGDVRQELNAKAQILEGVLRFLVGRGDLTRLPGGLMLATTAVAGLRRDLLATGWEGFTVQQFKERFGLARKWAIPLLEHLDGLGVTRRVGDSRVLLHGG